MLPNNQSELVNISVNDIYSHPDNPRKELGDLSELAESIKKNGIMQNLTVIPGHYEGGNLIDGGYTLIIGHRRCSAAKQAGIESVPCRIIENMDKKEQVSTMLEENMQRNDLTIYEQAQGFQMMLDLGETEETISNKTGFSKSTIRHRLNIAKLDSDELQKKEKSFQLTLKDLYELEKIKDVEKRNQVLREARDSSNLIFLSKQAADEEKKERKIKQFEKLFAAAGIEKAPDKAKKERYNGKWTVVVEWFYNNNDLPDNVEFYRNKKLIWVDYGYAMALIKPNNKKEKKLSKWEIEENKKKMSKKELQQTKNLLITEVKDFIKSIIDGTVRSNKEEIVIKTELIKALVESKPSFYESDLIIFYFGKNKSLYELEHDMPDKYSEYCEWKDSLSVVNKAILRLTSVISIDIWNYNINFLKDQSKRVKAVIDFLELYGFSASKECIQYIDGTHASYRK